MLGINNGFVPADDGVHILKKHDPWKYRMGKAGFLSFFVVLAEISSSVKEFFRNEGGGHAKAPISAPCRPAAFSSFSFKCQPRRLVNYLGRKAEEKSEDFSMEDDARREV